ncbi:MAG: hypothetical protein K6F66_06655 [Pseudobutyrivibrio sp.]|nr:hypothetical protein [Pseudobutyrivibrio sp.]
MNLIYKLDDVAEKKFFCEMITYISECIEEYKVAEDYTTVELKFNEEYENEVVIKLNNLKDMANKQLVGEQKKLDIKTLEDYTANEPIQRENVFPQLIEKGSIYSLADGSYAYGDIFLKVYTYFEKKIDEFGYEHFDSWNIEEQRMPVLYSLKGYEEGGYFETFPHHIMFESVLKNDLDVIDQFSKNGLKEENEIQQVSFPDNVLRTATCAPVYKFLQNQVIPSDSVRCFLVSGRCFRNEGSNVKTLQRLKEFYMKEYVFVGDQDRIDNGIEEAKGLWRYWIDVFGLKAKIDTANDSFFANNYKKLKLFQLLGQSKQEYKIYIPCEEDYISCGSANFHRTHFSKRYRIYDGDESKLANSGCFAFGVDRLAYALLSQKGIDSSKWDESTRNEISKYVNI